MSVRRPAAAAVAVPLWIRTERELESVGHRLAEVGSNGRVQIDRDGVARREAAAAGGVHGDGADAVYDRVVTDLGVSPTSFGVTDLIVTLERTAAGTRRVSTIEEVPDGQSDGFARLFDRSTGALRSTGRLDRGNATLVETLCRPEETYAEVRQALTDRSEKLNDFVRTDRTALDAVTARRQSRS